MKSKQKHNISQILEKYDIKNISMHTDNLEEDSAFCVTKYVKDYIDLALSQGAKFIISEHEIPDLPSDIPNIIVPNIKEFIYEASQILYPNKPQYMVGVTGTSGKTSIVDYCRQIWAEMGLKSASIGTMGIICSDKDIEDKVGGNYKFVTNTPDTITIHKILHKFAENGVDYVAFEVSSHGLDQDRIKGIKLKSAIFSNLSPEHLDYHKTMEEYKRAKLRIFTHYLDIGGTAITSDKLMEDDEVREALEGRDVLVVSSYIPPRHCEEKRSSEPATHEKTGDFADQKSLVCHASLAMKNKKNHNGADIIITSIISNPTSQILEFTYKGEAYKKTLNMIGAFQSSNILMALASIISCGFDFEKVITTLENIKPVAGRLERITNLNHPYHIFTDYAHKPEALEVCLRELKKLCTNRLFVLFGCGGNRDALKRPIMGKIATDIADVTFVTDDSPRYEDPASIRKDIMKAAPGAIEVADRAEAIKKAIEMLEKGDILLLAGKGHEDYQIFGNRKVHICDTEEARKYIC